MMQPMCYTGIDCTVLPPWHTIEQPNRQQNLVMSCVALNVRKEYLVCPWSWQIHVPRYLPKLVVYYHHCDIKDIYSCVKQISWDLHILSFYKYTHSWIKRSREKILRRFNQSKTYTFKSGIISKTTCIHYVNRAA